jgi:hypothetical protein
MSDDCSSDPYTCFAFRDVYLGAFVVEAFMVCLNLIFEFPLPHLVNDLYAGGSLLNAGVGSYWING